METLLSSRLAGRSRSLAVAGILLGVSLALAACGAAGASPQLAVPASSQAAAGTSAGGSVQATQTSEGGQVTIAISWPGLSAGPSFKVAMDTHSVDLDGVDLRQLATLRVDNGPALQPSTWDAPKGGHHRSGTLTFPGTTPSGSPTLAAGSHTVQVVIRDVARVPKRTFQWTS